MDKYLTALARGGSGKGRQDCITVTEQVNNKPFYCQKYCFFMLHAPAYFLTLGLYNKTFMTVINSLA